MPARYKYIDTQFTEFDSTSRKLDQYYRRDFSPIKTVLRQLFPTSSDEIINSGQLRTVPILHAICRELATLYALAPKREFRGLLSQDLAIRMRQIYRGMAVDRKMRVAHEMLICQANAVLLVMPDGAGRVQLLCLPPHRVKADRSDLLTTDARSGNRWRIDLPRKQNAITSLTNDTLVITESEAYWENEGTGAWNEDGTNPLGVAPVIVCRAGEPTPGHMFAPLPTDLLHLQENSIVAFTDIFRSAMYSAHGQKCIKGMSSGEARQLTLGPDVVLGLEEDQTYSVVSGSPHVAEYLLAHEGYLSAVLGANRVNVESLMKSGSQGKSGQAKVMDRSDRSVERKILQTELVDNAEQRLYRMIARWVNAMQGRTVFPINGIEVDVEFRKEEPEIDKLHAAQALVLRQKMGLESPAQVVSRERGVSMSEAQQIVAQNLNEYRDLLQTVGEVDAKIDKGAGGASGAG